eukprot:3775521-Pyramimonas_sp.AAC.1
MVFFRSFLFDPGEINKCRMSWLQKPEKYAGSSRKQLHGSAIAVAHYTRRCRVSVRVDHQQLSPHTRVKKFGCAIKKQMNPAPCPHIRSTWEKNESGLKTLGTPTDGARESSNKYMEGKSIAQVGRVEGHRKHAGTRISLKARSESAKVAPLHVCTDGARANIANGMGTKMGLLPQAGHLWSILRVQVR